MRGCKAVLAAAACGAVLLAGGCATPTIGSSTQDTVIATHRIVRTLDQNLQASVEQLGSTTRGLSVQLDEYDRQIRQLNDAAEENQRKIETLQARLDDLTTTLYRQLNLSPPTPTSRPPVVEPPRVDIERPQVSAPPVTAEPAPVFEPMPPAIVEAPVPPPPPPEPIIPDPAGNPVEEYSQARDAYINDDYNGALTLFDAFLRRYPGTELAPNAQFWKAQSYFKIEQYDEAIRQFELFRETYPGQTTRIPMALHQEAVALANLGQVEQARRLFQRLIDEYPMDPAADGARERLRELDRR